MYNVHWARNPALTSQEYQGSAWSSTRVLSLRSAGGFFQRNAVKISYTVPGRRVARRKQETHDSSSKDSSCNGTQLVNSVTCVVRGTPDISLLRAWRNSVSSGYGFSPSWINFGHAGFYSGSLMNRIPAALIINSQWTWTSLLIGSTGPEWKLWENWQFIWL